MGWIGVGVSAKLRTTCALILAVAVGGLSYADAVNVNAARAETSPPEVEPSLSIEGRVVPSTLPRAKRIPARLQVGFELEAADGRVPELNSISIQITGNVSIKPKGLPSCPISRLFSSYGNPGNVCPQSLIGHGAVASEIALPRQTPTMAEGKLQAFYSVTEGKPLVLADVTTDSPPLTYVIPFELDKADDPFGTRLIVRKMADIEGICVRQGCPQPYRLKGIYSRISSLELSLHRAFVTHSGKQASVVAASCPAPGQTSSEHFNLDEVSLSYVGGGLSADLLGRCKVAGQQAKGPSQHIGRLVPN